MSSLVALSTPLVRDSDLTMPQIGTSWCTHISDTIVPVYSLLTVICAFMQFWNVPAGTVQASLLMTVLGSIALPVPGVVVLVSFTSMPYEKP